MRERSPSYRKSMASEPCWVCGARDGTVVGAHDRRGQKGGIGLKPPDWALAALCWHHHILDHEGGEARDWVWLKVQEFLMRERYNRWKEE